MRFEDVKPGEFFRYVHPPDSPYAGRSYGVVIKRTAKGTVERGRFSKIIPPGVPAWKAPVRLVPASDVEKHEGIYVPKGCDAMGFPR